MESGSSLGHLHQQLGDFTLRGHTVSPAIGTTSGGGNRNHGLSWHEPDKRTTPALPSLPPWANANQSMVHRSHSREENQEYDHGSLPNVPPLEGWRKPRPYFMALKQLPAKMDADEHQHYQENDEPTHEQQRHEIENHAGEPELASPCKPNPSQNVSVKKASSVRLETSSSIDRGKKENLHEEDEEPTSSGSGSETNQQEEQSPLQRSPVRGQFFRPWKKKSRRQDDCDDDSISSEGWSPPISNKWKTRAIMDPFAKRRPTLKNVQPPPRAQSPPDPPPRELTKIRSLVRAAASTSPRMKAPAPCQLNPLRLSSADRMRAAVHRRPVTPVSTPISPPPVPLHSRISRDTSRESLGQSEDLHNDSEPAAPRRVRHIKGSDPAHGGKKQSKKSTVDALNEIKRKREARRAEQAKDKRRVQKELREHGDDAGYKFRRLIQQYRDALPPSQQPQQPQQLPPLSVSSSSRPSPTPTRMLANAADTPRLSVFIRKRPLAKKELKANGYDIISCLFAQENQDTNDSLLRRNLVCHEPKLRVDCSETLENHEFRFDGVFDEWQENSKVYDASVGRLVPYLVSEATATGATTSLTVFAYGQTGSGKTYTMKSIYRQAALDLFQQLEMMESTSHRTPRVEVGVSFYEIYMNNVNDLLNGRQRVQLMEDGDGAVQLPGLKELPASSADELLELVQLGEQARATSANAVHDDSSRSHALLRVTLYAEGNNNGAALARLSMVDLAGSERAGDTQSDKKSTRKEGAEINKSLLALKECIRALDRGAMHIPFRQSKLTQLLRDSFLSENSKTVMIATVSPWSESCNHTLNTLRYADRLKEIGAAS